MLRILSFCLMIFFTLSTFADTPNPASSKKINNVIYITLDGVRWQEFFLDHQYFKKFWQKYAHDAHIYGMPESHTIMTVASIPISLPSYQSQMAGEVQPCPGNNCDRINVETFPEKLKYKLRLNMKDIAVISSWYRISHAAEHIEGTVFSNTGNYPMLDPDTHVPDEVMYALNLQQAYDHPSNTLSRFDKYTMAQAIHYLEVYKPRFLWISLNDADNAAHKGNLESYHNFLYSYDDFIDLLIEKLKLLNLYDETLVIVTTDHGRGHGPFWTSHGPQHPASKRTWAFTLNGDLKSVSRTGDFVHYSTLSIRPTIESVMGA